MGILWIIIIGFIASVVTRLILSGPDKPSGFILTTVLGVAGAFVATHIGQAVGWYRADQGAGFIGAVVGAVVVPFIWNRFDASRTPRVWGSRRSKSAEWICTFFERDPQPTCWRGVGLTSASPPILYPGDSLHARYPPPERAFFLR